MIKNEKELIKKIYKMGYFGREYWELWDELREEIDKEYEIYLEGGFENTNESYQNEFMEKSDNNGFILLKSLFDKYEPLFKIHKGKGATLGYIEIFNKHIDEIDKILEENLEKNLVEGDYNE